MSEDVWQTGDSKWLAADGSMILFRSIYIVDDLSDGSWYIEIQGIGKPWEIETQS